MSTKAKYGRGTWNSILPLVVVSHEYETSDSSWLGVYFLAPLCTGEHEMDKSALVSCKRGREIKGWMFGQGEGEPTTGAVVRPETRCPASKTGPSEEAMRVLEKPL